MAPHPHHSGFSAEARRWPLPPWALRLVAGRDLDSCGRDLTETCVGTALRTRANLVLPVLALLMATAGLGAMALAAVSAQPDMTFAMGRVFLFDYGLFLASWVSGWNMARRWRTNSEMVEEVALAPLPPRHAALALISGHVASWGIIVAVFCVLEVLLFLAVFAATQDGNYLSFAFAAPFAAIFHFETIRLGHALFAVGAMPRTPLASLARNNFIVITLLVFILSGLGSMATLVVAVILSLMSLQPDALGMAGVWIVGSVPAYLGIAFLKRLITNGRLEDFERRWLQFQWWGAAETEHPEDHGRAMHNAAALWQLYLRALEEMATRPRGTVGPCMRRYERLRTMPMPEWPPKPPAARAPGTLAPGVWTPPPPQ